MPDLSAQSATGTTTVRQPPLQAFRDRLRRLFSVAGKSFLVIADRLSGGPVVIPRGAILPPSTPTALLPGTSGKLVSRSASGLTADPNSLALTSGKFMERWGVHHAVSSPHYPRVAGPQKRDCDCRAVARAEQVKVRTTSTPLPAQAVSARTVRIQDPTSHRWDKVGVVMGCSKTRDFERDVSPELTFARLFQYSPSPALAEQRLAERSWSFKKASAIFFPGQLKHSEHEACSTHSGTGGTCERSCSHRSVKSELLKCGIKDSNFLYCCDSSLDCGRNSINQFFFYPFGDESAVILRPEAADSPPQNASTKGPPPERRPGIPEEEFFDFINDDSTLPPGTYAAVGGIAAEKNAWPWMVSMRLCE
ncbi:hypothetical protein GWK47_054910 [Chionoecetes opilio]|uniref:Uncharacterized protein n=1 Tax=Chionoecetes opilio TaxID=41210 RepID=A0A8J4Y427_CHIOP|nr:hypothetical protein GWK47_054910 [Chionoecetes opilio]